MLICIEFHNNGYGCFVMGGAVRDCLMGGGGAFAPQDPEDMKIKDIDLGFGCSADEAKIMCEAKGWTAV
jgi:tRNA nucleotidyltransferase/poly(A) polymerase